jgi:hypothetical protein
VGQFSIGDLGQFCTGGNKALSCVSPAVLRALAISFGEGFRFLCKTLFPLRHKPGMEFQEQADNRVTGMGTLVCMN